MKLPIALLAVVLPALSLAEPPKAAASPYSLDLRVSLDGMSAEENDPVRGRGTFLPEAGTLLVDVSDMLGRRVWSSSSTHPAGAAEVVIDTGSWTRGSYVVRATAAGAVATTRLVRR